MCAQQHKDEGNTHVARHTDPERQAGWRQGSTSPVSHKRHLFVCLASKLEVLFFTVPTRPAGTSFTAHLYGWVKLDDGLWKRGGGLILDGILVTWGELLSSFNPPPWTPFPPPPVPTPWCTGRMQCQEGEHWAPIVCANQSGMPGWQKGEEWAQGTQSQGEERVGGGGGEGRRGGQSAGG